MLAPRYGDSGHMLSSCAPELSARSARGLRGSRGQKAHALPIWHRASAVHSPIVLPSSLSPTCSCRSLG